MHGKPIKRRAIQMELATTHGNSAKEREGGSQ